MFVKIAAIKTPDAQEAVEYLIEAGYEQVLDPTQVGGAAAIARPGTFSVLHMPSGHSAIETRDLNVAAALIDLLANGADR